MIGLQSPPGNHANADGTGRTTTELDAQRKPAKLPGPIVSLQRVWKTYVKGRDELLPGDCLSSTNSDGDTTPGSIPSILFTPADRSNGMESVECAQQENGMNVRSKGSPTRRNVPELENYHLPVSTYSGVDSDTESVVSDYSEMADPVKEHLANVQIIRCPDLDPTSPTQFIVREKVLRGVGEGGEEFVRRLRKTNFLSLAQEFAELKKQNENALPFNLHEERYRDRRESESETDEMEEISTDSRSTVDVSVSRDEPEGGYDSGWQDETMPQPETNLSRGDLVGATSISDNDFSTDVSGLLGLKVKLKEDTGFNEARCAGAGETHSENGVLSSSDRTGKSTEPFSAENIPDVFLDRQSISPFVTSNHTREFSSLYIGQPETKYDRRNCFAGSSIIDDLQEDLDDFTIEKSFPKWDWERLENGLMQTSQVEHNERLQRDRDEVLRRLAILDEEEWCSGGEGELSHVPNGSGLDMCYVNEAADDPDPSNWDGFESTRPDIVPFDHILEEVDTLNCCSGDDLRTKQATLEAEAKLALAEVRSLVQLQLKAENHMLEESLITEMVGTSSSGEKVLRCIGRQNLERMAMAQLQITANDLHSQIEVLNRDLMLGLMERDDLHMVQDSMLVDIEDLTGMFCMMGPVRCTTCSTTYQMSSKLLQQLM